MFLLWVFIHCVSKKVYHSTTNDNFNSSCLIPVIVGTNITKIICHRKMVYFHLFNIHTLPYGNFRNLKIAKSSVKEHISRINQIIFTLVVHGPFWSYEQLTMSVQIVVHLHACTLFQTKINIFQDFSGTFKDQGLP